MKDAEEFYMDGFEAAKKRIVDWLMYLGNDENAALVRSLHPSQPTFPNEHEAMQ